MLQLLINILSSSAIILLISSSFSIIYYPVKFFHFAHAIILTCGAYFTYLFFKELNLFLWLSILLSIFLSTVLGLTMEMLVYRNLRKQSVSPLQLLIASLGLFVIIQNIVSIIWGDKTKSIRFTDVQAGIVFFDAYITKLQLITIFLSATLFLLTHKFMKGSPVGRQMRAVSSNPELAEIFGINTNKIIFLAFGLGSSLVAIAGILVAFDTDMTPTMGFNLLLYGVVAMIIGGVGSDKGLIGGAVLLSTAQHVGAYCINGIWMDAIAYIILILFLIWKPLGFSGKRLKKIEI